MNTPVIEAAEGIFLQLSALLTGFRVHAIYSTVAYCESNQY
jgi:hypothetical protein